MLKKDIVGHLSFTLIRHDRSSCHYFNWLGLNVFFEVFFLQFDKIMNRHTIAATTFEHTWSFHIEISLVEKFGSF